MFTDVAYYLENNILFIWKTTLKSGLQFYGIDLVANGTSLTIIAVFLSTRFSSRLCNLTPKWYFFISMNYIEICIHIGRYLENNI